MILGAKKLGVVGRGPENWHFLFHAVPAGEVWALLGGPATVLGSVSYRSATTLTRQQDEACEIYSAA